jgi:hypothetical protein
MSIAARCGSCNRELLLGQLVQPSDGFQCPVCGFAFAPAYATVAPAVGARVMVAQAAVVTALAELASMTGGRLRLDRATVVDPVTQRPAPGPGRGRGQRSSWVAAVAPDQSPAVLMPSKGLGVASNHSDITPSRKTSEAWSALESNRVRGPSCLTVLGQRDAARLRRR